MSSSTALDPEAILREALDRDAYVTRFEIATPSIEDIFIERVGAMPTAERTLRARGGAADEEHR